MKMIGVVRTYKTQKGYGFAESEGRSVFFHVSNFDDDRIPEVNDVISFELGVDPRSKRVQAMNIRIIDSEHEYETNFTE